VKRLLLLAAALPLLLASPAQAGWRIDRAQAIAEIVWQQPCAGAVVLRWEAIDAARVAQADVAGCIVTFQNDEPTTWLAFCSNMLHEYGHLAGMGHAREGIMQADDSALDPRCRKRGRPYLERHGIL
jgi:F420-dependent methylenetetrahydromethanopterin dehydrogenase